MCYLSRGQPSPAEADRGPRTLTHTEPRLCRIYSTTLSRQIFKLILKDIDSAYQFNVKSVPNLIKLAEYTLPGRHHIIQEPTRSRKKHQLGKLSAPTHLDMQSPSKLTENRV